MAVPPDPLQTSNDLSEQLALDRFCRAVAASPAHQARLKAAASPEEILAIAAELNFLFTRQTLRLCSRDLASDYWPWAQKGSIWRREFFLA
ncbi:Nif11-like leader peptide family natural product precursor [Synechococcus sp. EJ6-Ellesmere]|uniref:Nif11-like leader peptide family natural product precursor n=1 Tax=Synechococcus sp. EJ6-Ellesmere TaxID=2823734 RepID=UPI0020CDCFF3|nr:Nif11-like leader peptide family natural product precursor [Synechococcus sp. EJ6-Ellesmere]MCP9826868.1 Nif11-like leader peptide family natural product precursor [Synechococcus sp. EJ6-Ellesmere]